MAEVGVRCGRCRSVAGGAGPLWEVPATQKFPGLPHRPTPTHTDPRARGTPDDTRTRAPGAPRRLPGRWPKRGPAVNSRHFIRARRRKCRGCWRESCHFFRAGPIEMRPGAEVVRGPRLGPGDTRTVTRPPWCAGNARGPTRCVPEAEVHWGPLAEVPVRCGRCRSVVGGAGPLWEVPATQKFPGLPHRPTPTHTDPRARGTPDDTRTRAPGAPRRLPGRWPKRGPAVNSRHFIRARRRKCRGCWRESCHFFRAGPIEMRPGAEVVRGPHTGPHGPTPAHTYP